MCLHASSTYNTNHARMQATWLRCVVQHAGTQRASQLRLHGNAAAAPKRRAELPPISTRMQLLLGCSRRFAAYKRCSRRDG